MRAIELTRDHVKQWVVQNAGITNPYRKKWWYAFVTINGCDLSEKGETIEKAYNALTEHIFTSPFIMGRLKDFKSFRKIIGWN